MIFVGFFVAAIGVLTPGMLNLTILQLSLNEGRYQAIRFARGAALIIFLQSIIGLSLAKYLEQNPNITENLKRIGIIIFFGLTFFFLFKGINSKKTTKLKVLKLNTTVNRFLYGMVLSMLNLFTIPYYALIALSLSSSSWFELTIVSISFFALGVGLGVYLVYSMYAIHVHKIQRKIRFLSENVNYFIAALTAFVALSTLIKMIIEK